MSKSGRPFSENAKDQLKSRPRLQTSVFRRPGEDVEEFFKEFVDSHTESEAAHQTDEQQRLEAECFIPAEPQSDAEDHLGGGSVAAAAEVVEPQSVTPKRGPTLRAKRHKKITRMESITLGADWGRSVSPDQNQEPPSPIIAKKLSFSSSAEELSFFDENKQEAVEVEKAKRIMATLVMRLGQFSYTTHKQIDDFLSVTEKNGQSKGVPLQQLCMQRNLAAAASTQLSFLGSQSSSAPSILDPSSWVKKMRPAPALESQLESKLSDESVDESDSEGEPSSGVKFDSGAKKRHQLRELSPTALLQKLFFEARKGLQKEYFKSKGFEVEEERIDGLSFKADSIFRGDEVPLDPPLAVSILKKSMRNTDFSLDKNDSVRLDYAIQLLTWTFGYAFALVALILDKDRNAANLEAVFERSAKAVEKIIGFCKKGEAMPAVGSDEWNNVNAYCVAQFEPFFEAVLPQYKKGDGAKWMKKNNPLISPQITLDPEKGYVQLPSLVFVYAENSVETYRFSAPIAVSVQKLKDEEADKKQVRVDNGEPELPELGIVMDAFLGDAALNSQAKSKLPRNTMLHLDLKYHNAALTNFTGVGLDREIWTVVGKPQFAMASPGGDTSLMHALSDVVKSEEPSKIEQNAMYDYLLNALNLFQEKAQSLGIELPDDGAMWHHLIANWVAPEYDIHKNIRRLRKKLRKIEVEQTEECLNRKKVLALLDNWRNFPNTDYKAPKVQMPVVWAPRLNEFAQKNPFLNDIMGAVGPELEPEKRILTVSAENFHRLIAFVEGKKVPVGSDRRNLDFVHVSDAARCLQSLYELSSSAGVARALALFYYLFLENRYASYRKNHHHTCWEGLKQKVERNIEFPQFLLDTTALYAKKNPAQEGNNGALSVFLAAAFDYLMHQALSVNVYKVEGCKSNKDRAGCYRLVVKYVEYWFELWPDHHTHPADLKARLEKRLKALVVSNAAALFANCQTPGTMPMQFMPKKGVMVAPNSIHGLLFDAVNASVSQTAVARRAPFMQKKRSACKDITLGVFSALGGGGVGALVGGIISIAASCAVLGPIGAGVAVGVLIGLLVFALISCGSKGSKKAKHVEAPSTGAHSIESVSSEVMLAN